MRHVIDRSGWTTEKKSVIREGRSVRIRTHMQIYKQRNGGTYANKKRAAAKRERPAKPRTAGRTEQSLRPLCVSHTNVHTLAFVPPIRIHTEKKGGSVQHVPSDSGGGRNAESEGHGRCRRRRPAGMRRTALHCGRAPSGGSNTSWMMPLDSSFWERERGEEYWISSFFTGGLRWKGEYNGIGNEKERTSFTEEDQLWKVHSDSPDWKRWPLERSVGCTDWAFSHKTVKLTNFGVVIWFLTIQKVHDSTTPEHFILQKREWWFLNTKELITFLISRGNINKLLS